MHYGFVESFILGLADKYRIKEIAFDPWNATQISQRLVDEELTMVQFRQGMRSLSPPTKELMQLTLSEELAHAGHPVLRCCMDNVHVFSNNNENIRPDKKISSERIDGAVATIMALSRAVCQPEKTTSIYDERGLLIL